MIRTLSVAGSQELASGLEVQWVADVRLAYRPGRFSGPPEACFPDESEAEVLSIATEPPGLADQLDESRVIERAWEQFDAERFA